MSRYILDEILWKVLSFHITSKKLDATFYAIFRYGVSKKFRKIPSLF